MRVLFVASTGGHLAQLNRLSNTIDHDENSRWVTFESEQSKSLLAGRNVTFVPYVAPRGLAGVFHTLRAVSALLSHDRYDLVVSTGAGIAVGAFLAAKVHRVRTLYIESVSRVQGPSLTGRITAFSRLASLRTQHEGWARGRWRKHPSVLSEFEAIDRIPAAPRPGLRIFVTLGTISPYRFDRLVDSLLATLSQDDELVWQLGVTDRTELPGRVQSMISAHNFSTEVQRADVVVTHAGVGTILDLLERGIHPVVVPRRVRRGEHVDDHQGQISALVQKLGIATVVEADALTRKDLEHASILATRPRARARSEADR